MSTVSQKLNCIFFCIFINIVFSFSIFVFILICFIFILTIRYNSLQQQEKIDNCNFYYNKLYIKFNIESGFYL